MTRNHSFSVPLNRPKADKAVEALKKHCDITHTTFSSLVCEALELYYEAKSKDLRS